MVVLVILLVVLAVVAFFLLRSIGVIGGSQVDVPDVVGQTVAAATSTLQGDGLTVGSTPTELSSQAQGTVVSTDPAGGHEGRQEQHGQPDVSAGSGVIGAQCGRRPADPGHQPAAAGRACSQTVSYVTSTKPVGNGAGPEPGRPPAGQARHSVVKLTVSGTQTLTTVPSVVGFSPAAAGEHAAAATT